MSDLWTFVATFVCGIGFGYTLGKYATILVHSFEKGDMAGTPRPGPRGDSEVQCYTTDRIPFCMPRRRLLERYEPQ